MSPKSSTLIRTAALLASAVALTGSARAVSLYFQDFTDSSASANYVLSSKIPTWNAYISSKAFNTKFANAYQTNTNNDAFGGSKFGPQQANLFTQGSGAAGQLGGYILHQTTTADGASGSPVFASVYEGESLGINIAGYSSINFTWQQNANNTGITSRLMLKVNGSWYVSNTSVAPTVGDRPSLDTATHTKSLTFSSDASQWSVFTLTPSTNNNIYNPDNGALTIGGTAVSALSGTIEAIGIYSAFPTFNAATGTAMATRIDQIAINGIAAVPEPSSVALLFGVAGLGFAASRRRRC